MPRMTPGRLLAIWATRPEAFAAEPDHIQARYQGEVDFLRDVPGATPTRDGRVSRPPGAEVLPPGYRTEGHSGGYFTLIVNPGTVVPGPSNGKWQGRDGAVDAAWSHYLR